MDYVPQKIANKMLWLANLVATITLDGDAYNVSVELLSELTTTNLNAQVAYAVSVEPTTRTPVAVANTNSAVALAVAKARVVNSFAQTSDASNAQLVAAGLPVRDTTRSPQTPVTASVDLELISAVPQILSIQARNPATPTTKAKPIDTGGVQFAIAIGTVAAVDPAQATRRELFTRNPVRLGTSVDDRGKMATIFARYQSRGSIGGVKVYGPWSLPLAVNLP